MNRAQILAADESALRRDEQQIEDLLSLLFPTWRGWVFTTPDRIDVYQANYRAESVRVLHRNGFVRVMVHAHRAARYVPCECILHTRR